MIFPLLTLAFPWFPSSTPGFERFDVANPFQKHVRTKVIVRPLPIKKAVLPPKPKPFDIHFECETTLEKCALVKEKFKIACEKLSALLVIRQTIKVFASIRSFCTPQDCQSSGVLGQASAGAYFIGRFTQNGDWHYIPQALIKQLQPSMEPEYSEWDIMSAFNADYLSETPTIDLVWLIAHELSHGLAFDSFLYPWQFLYGTLAKIENDFIAPPLLLERSIWSAAYVRGDEWDHVHLYDSFLMDSATNESISSLLNQIKTFTIKKRVPLQVFVDEFRNSTQFILAQKMNALMTTGPKRLIFSFPDAVKNLSHPMFQNDTQGDQLYIATFDGYRFGSTSAHLDYETYSNTSDFCMIYALDTKSVETKSQNYGGHIFGLKTLKLFASMGWPTVLDPNSQRVYLKPAP